MGAEKSLRLAAELAGVDVLCMAKDGGVRRSAGFPVGLAAG